MAISPSPFERMRPRRKQRSPLWLVWLGLVVVLVAGVVVFRQPAGELFWRAVAPAAHLRAALGSSEAEQLRGELAAAQAKLADRDALYKETIELKALLGRTDEAGARTLAGVILRPPWTPYDTLVIDAGAAHGVVEGALVSAGGQALVGRVVEVYANQSRVELFSAPGSNHQAMLNGTVPVAVEGQGGASMQALVPAGTVVAVGDEVLFPGLAGGLVATVSAVDAEAGESFIVIYMQLAANPAHLRYVEVLTP
jgi:cell shape-determining protein MreC